MGEIVEDKRSRETEAALEMGSQMISFLLNASSMNLLISHKQIVSLCTEQETRFFFILYFSACFNREPTRHVMVSAFMEDS